MIFIYKLREFDTPLEMEFDKLFALALRNQSHNGDLLLIHENGFYDSDTHIFNKHSEEKFNPHAIGPGNEGHSEYTHYLFIDKYRQSNIHELGFKEYLKLYEYSDEREKEIDDLQKMEGLGIQLEMLIYIKIWEADLFIKKLYEFVRILHREHYDWYFKLKESSRSLNFSGERHEIIRSKIRDKIQDISPLLFETIKRSYKTQIRNSIAHSNYSFLGRSIHLNNFVEGDPHSQIRVVTFNEWTDIFHQTLSLYDQYIRLDNLIQNYYKQIAENNNNKVEILVTEENGKAYPTYLSYDLNIKRWFYESK
ncbi:MAG: hypothetical protein M3Z26_10480 [Bacteroidota bacterium]|nr:hypothetical protein [Bacteroidota bacterium]